MNIIDGKLVASKIKDDIKEKVSLLGYKPKLVCIVVGDNAASKSYVKSKVKVCAECGIESEVISFDENISQYKLVSKIEELNCDNSVNGIIVQLPLPEHIDEKYITNVIDSSKDVDGFTDENIGRLCNNKSALTPATPKGIMSMIDYYGIELSGKNVVVIGRSNIVGKPVAHLMLQRNANVTVLHSKTTRDDMLNYCKNADVLVVAVGNPEFITKEFIKPGATVIDVGINRISADNEKGYRIVGDVKFDEVSEIAGYITPVPGGVGLTTVASLIDNTLIAAQRNYNNLTKEQYLNTGEGLIANLRKTGFLSSGMVVVDNNDDEYIVKDISITMGGQEHPVIELEKIDDPKQKWFRTKEVYIDELKEQLALYQSEQWHNDWLKISTEEKYQQLIDRQKSHIESVERNYKPGEIVD